MCLCVCVRGWSPFPPPLPTPSAFPSVPPGLMDFFPATVPPYQGLLLLMFAWTSAAFMPLACAFTHFHTEPLVSITPGALQAFRCRKQDLNPTGRQISVHPSSLTPVGGWLPQSCSIQLPLVLGSRLWLPSPEPRDPSLPLLSHFARSSLSAGPRGGPRAPSLAQPIWSPGAAALS